MRASEHRFVPSRSELISDKLGVAFPVKGGIPDLTPTAGRMLGDEDWQSSWAKEAGISKPVDVDDASGSPHR